MRGKRNTHQEAEGDQSILPDETVARGTWTVGLAGRPVAAGAGAGLRGLPVGQGGGQAGRAGAAGHAELLEVEASPERRPALHESRVEPRPERRYRTVPSVRLESSLLAVQGENCCRHRPASCLALVLGGSAG